MINFVKIKNLPFMCLLVYKYNLNYLFQGEDMPTMSDIDNFPFLTYKI